MIKDKALEDILKDDRIIEIKKKYIDPWRAATFAHEKKAGEILEVVNGVMIDERFSEKGKADAIAKMKAELNKLNNENRDHLKNLITEFCKEMKLKFQDDGKDHAAEVANALKVIDMIGIPEITPDIVSSLVKPFQNAYDSLKIIYDLFKVKSEKSSLGCDPKSLDMLAAHMGIKDEFKEYIDRVEDLESKLNYAEFSFYRLTSMNYGGGERFSLLIENGYEIEAIPDEMLQIAIDHIEFTEEYPLTFK